MSLLGFSLLLVSTALAEEGAPVVAAPTAETSAGFSPLPNSLRWVDESSWQPEKGELYLSLLELPQAPVSTSDHGCHDRLHDGLQGAALILPLLGGP